ncbi:hypothetical protein [Desulfobotulus mexicanus]|uniref:Uncharacterized protein n=1 Tax=Desulfobotulus mexicanus TaxID=2586642 RepID=A0A5Q4VJ02_9BACT|nr:hypothetical protein [Desulfobotulus mexicanus]TYT76187.1 hypothetical protein FIM25_01140 [Desulfobotulus mexicanus]
MDRITNRPEYTPAPDIRNTEKDSSSKTSGTGFQDALKTAMTPMTPSSSSMTVQSPLPPPRTMGFAGLFDSSSMEDRTRDLVSNMERFSSALMNPDQGIRELKTMIEALEKEAETLMKESMEQEENPSGNLAKRTALLARVEVEKFRRGDFF